jgi:hypothetical protein
VGVNEPEDLLLFFLHFAFVVQAFCSLFCGQVWHVLGFVPLTRKQKSSHEHGCSVVMFPFSMPCKISLVVTTWRRVLSLWGLSCMQLHAVSTGI